MSAALAIALVNLRELRRKRIVLLPLIVAAVTMLVLVFGPISDRSAADTYLTSSTYFFRMALTVAMLSAGASNIADEVETGTVLLLALRPVRRGTIVLGKLLGNTAFALAALAAWGVIEGAILAVRTGHSSYFGDSVATCVVSIGSVMLIGVVATTASTLMSSRNSAMIGIALWFGSSVAAAVANGLSLARHRHESVNGFAWLEPVSNAATYVLPKSRLDAFADAAGATHAGSPNAFKVLLAFVAIAAWVVLAQELFTRRRSLT
jgi:ABC-type transport system involved in multi-copper enzyme maturation permease subunit